MSDTTPVEEWAPPDPDWHWQYARTMQKIYQMLATLQAHPSTKDAEDLGDYVEVLCSLITFRPQTATEVESAVRLELGVVGE